MKKYGCKYVHVFYCCAGFVRQADLRFFLFDLSNATHVKRLNKPKA